MRRLVQQMGDDPCTISWLVQIPCDEVNILIKGLAPLEGSAPEPITEHIRKLQRPMAHKRALTAAAQQHTYERCKHPGRTKPCLFFHSGALTPRRQALLCGQRELPLHHFEYVL